MSAGNAGPTCGSRRKRQHKMYSTQKSEQKKRYYRKNRKRILKKSNKRYHGNVVLHRKRGREQYLIHKEEKLAYRRTFRGRHSVLKVALRKEKISRKDPLWSLEFYTALIQDGICHYCFGPLNLYGAGLDCMNNEIGHVGFNVVPCCRSCNQKKMHDLSYEEMMLLAPVLREIVRRRAQVKG